MGYQYIAAPYTHKEASVREERVRLSAVACVRMLQRGGYPYSPLVHGHCTETLTGIILPYKVWMQHCLAILKKADSFYILTLDGWSDSNGLQEEKALAIKYGIPVGYLNAAIWCAEKELLDTPIPQLVRP